ncbi:MAG TPA: hypothetical protein VH834_22030 [Solirubrobacteraceae bacterium]|jgi:hypothetical protein
MSDTAKPRVAEHPVAARQIARVRAWAAVLGFVVTFWLSHRAGLPFPECGARAIVVGVVCRVVAWAVIVSVWRQVIPAQIKAIRNRGELAAADAAEHAEGVS